MNLSEILKDIKGKFGHKSKEENSTISVSAPDAEEEADEASKQEMRADEPEGNTSLVEGDHGKIIGLSKPAIITIGAGIFLMFFLATMFAVTNDSSEETKPQKQLTTEQIAGVDAAKNNKNAKKIAGDYEQALAQRNANKVATPGQENNQSNQEVNKSNTVQATPSNASVPVTQPASPVPAIPNINAVRPVSYAQNYELPSQASPQQISQKKQEENSLAEKAKKKLESAIAFFGGNNDNASSNSADTEASASESVGAVKQNNSQPVNVSYTAPQPNTVMAGTIIPVMLMTGINTDTPGQVIAQVMADVYDIDGYNILIPAGSKVLGSTGENGNAESGRVNVTFSTLVLPNGGSWNIGQSMVAMDGAGFTGIKGVLHRHTGSNFMKGVFNSAMTALSTIAVDRVTLDASALSSVASTQKPTTTVDPGYQFNVYVTQNIRF